MGLNDRFRLPLDLIKRIEDISQRISRLERTPRFISTAIDGGALVVKNANVSITIEDSTGTPVIILSHSTTGDAANFVIFAFSPAGTNRAVAIAQDFFGNAANQTAFQFYHSDGTEGNGARLICQSLATTIAYTPNVGNEGFLQVSSGPLYMRGTWPNNVQIANTDAVSTGSQSVSAGVSSVTISYNSAFASTIVPIVGFHSASGAVDWCLTAQSTSSFTVAWTDTTAKIINWWSIRL